jgi:hypothetical protein
MKHRIPAWLHGHIHRLGVEPDGAIADDVGMTDGTVRYQRKKLGIPAFQPRLDTSDPSIVQAAGLVSDAELAEAIGATAEAVRQLRGRLGVRRLTIRIDAATIAALEARYPGMALVAAASEALRAAVVG